MKLGFMCAMANNGVCTLEETIAEVQEAEAMGFDQAWMAQAFAGDAIGALSIIARETTGIRFGTAVTPSYPRHPVALAQQVLTASAASGGRFELGLGLSHQVVIEDMFGIPYRYPARHMEEYLQVLLPLLRGERCQFQGELFQVNTRLRMAGSTPSPVVVAALGPKMLAVAGRLAAGTITWMTGPRTLAEHVIPRIRQAAEDAGQGQPRIVASLPIALSANPAATRAAIAEQTAVYGYMPSYRRMLDLEGVAAPGDIALVGDAAALSDALAELAAIGVTDFNAFCYPLDEHTVASTMEFLADWKK